MTQITPEATAISTGVGQTYFPSASTSTTGCVVSWNLFCWKYSTSGNFRCEPLCTDGNSRTMLANHTRTSANRIQPKSAYTGPNGDRRKSSRISVMR